MGMDLKPIAPSDNAPRDKGGEPIWGRYNIWSWGNMVRFAESHGVDISEFSGFNDGLPISDATCKQVSQEIRNHIHEYMQLFNCQKQEAEDDALLWETCGGYEQW